MIPVANITAWRASVPWADESLVEQDLVLSRALVEIFAAPDLASSLTLRGGTALHKLHLHPPWRYSEDIDLVQNSAGPIGAVLDSLRARLDPWLGTPRRQRGPGIVTLIYRFESENIPIVPLRLKVEINTREHFSVMPLLTRSLTVQNRWFAGTADVVTYTLEELLATKLRALYQRKKGRDLFDLWSALHRTAAVPVKIVECFERYLTHAATPISRSDFEANLADKLLDPAFTADLSPLLAAGISYDAFQAATTLRHSILSLLPDTNRKKAPMTQ